MRKESLRQSSLPCDPFKGDDFDKEAYHVASTGAIANLSSSISLIYLYCSRLPADGLVSSLLPPLSGFSSFILMNLRYTFFLHFFLSLCFILFFFHLYHYITLSDTLNRLQGGTKKLERCIFQRAVLYSLFV